LYRKLKKGKNIDIFGKLSYELGVNPELVEEVQLGMDQHLQNI
jgi:hypothetical protein